jgi:hypothetical protein
MRRLVSILILLTVLTAVARADEAPRWMPSASAKQLRADGQERVVGGAIATAIGAAGLLVGLGLTLSQWGNGLGCALSDHQGPCQTDQGLLWSGVGTLLAGGLLTGVGLGFTISGVRIKRRAERIELGLTGARVHF